MSSQLTIPVSTTSPRRELSERQAATVHQLVLAALAELRDGGYDRLTVRRVATRAGVAPATAYNYFASKDHLVTEVFWRRLSALPDTTIDRRRKTVGRVAAALDAIADAVAAEPELAAACMAAMLGSEPDVVRLRLRVGVEIRRRLEIALGDDATEDVLEALSLLVTGALMTAGMGHIAYTDLAQKLADLSALVVRGGAA